MTYPNDPNFQPEHRRDVEQEVPVTASFTKATWASIAFLFLLFGAVALWAYNSGDMQTASVKRPGAEQSVPPATTGQGGAASKMPAAKDAAQ